MQACKALTAGTVVATILAAASLAMPGEAGPINVDVCVYGGTSAGVVAALTTARLGKSVVLVEPGRHLGGMTTGGLGYTDFGNKAVIGGISRDFYKQVGKHYGKEEAWTFEPHVAEQVYKDWIAAAKVRVLFEHRLQRVAKERGRIRSIVLERVPPDEAGAPAAKAMESDAAVVVAGMFIDATYEGDLMAGAKVSYTVGRESAEQYGEPLNGVRAKTPSHQFIVRTDPYVKAGDASSGLLPLIQAGDGGKPGSGDRSVQAYNFRMCLTKNPDNKLPIAPPAGYDEKRYEILGRYFDALATEAGKKPTLGMFLKIDMMPNGKTDINNNGAVSTDFIGENYAYPDGDWAARSRIWKAQQEYTRGLLCYLASSPRVLEDVRREMQLWGLCKDEFADTGGWPHQMYIREARRMVGRYVITQADCEHKRVAEDSVGIGAYNMDSHNCQRIVKNGAVENEGDVQVRPTGPYPVSYRAMTPKAEECENLLVPVCLSASHMAYGSVRMEPVFMALAQSAATAACQAMEEGRSVQEIDMPRLQRRLLEAGQVLTYSRPAR